MNPIVAGTGHRPPRLGLGYDPKSRERLFEFALKHIRPLQPKKIISGMANGWDQALAAVAVELNVPLTAALPFECHGSNWPAEGEKYHDYLVGKAEEVIVVCPGKPAGWKYIRRDHWMVKHATILVALWDGERSGGTWATVDYALQKGVEVLNLWASWSGVGTTDSYAGPTS